jgi:hypothetical protein
MQPRYADDLVRMQSLPLNLEKTKKTMSIANQHNLQHPYLLENSLRTSDLSLLLWKSTAGAIIDILLVRTCSSTKVTTLTDGCNCYCSKKTWKGKSEGIFIKSSVSRRTLSPSRITTYARRWSNWGSKSIMNPQRYSKNIFFKDKRWQPVLKEKSFHY